LVTLLVVSLLMVLVVSFSVYVRLGLREVNERQLLLQARQNARLAMNMALARLQESAGQDRRVTARAEILGSGAHSQNRYVTGVWDTSNPNSSPDWLISTTAGSFNPLTPITGTDSALLLGDGTLGISSDAGDYIWAGKREVAASSLSGHYAWWVSDEGVKASLSLGNDLARTPEIGSLHRTEMDRLRFATPERSEQNYAFAADLDFEDPLLNNFSEFILNLNQYPLQAPLTDPRQGEGFHHFTHRALGLLTNTVNGGVKKDLSLDPSPLGTGFEQFMDFTSYLIEPNNTEPIVRDASDLRRVHAMTAPSNPSPTDGEIVHKVAPIITDFGLQFSPRRNSSSTGRASLMMAIVLELWNPYTTALPAEDLILEISGFEPFDVNLRDPNSNTVVWSETFDPNQIIGSTVSLRLGRDQFHTTRYVDANAYDSQLHGPGRFLYWTGPVQSRPNQATFANRQSAQSRLQQSLPTPVTFPTGSGTHNLDVGYEMPESTLTVRLRRAPENGGEILVEHSNLVYDEVDTVDHGSLGQWDNRWLTYRFRIIERGTTYLADRTAWLKHVDKRTPVPSFGDDITLDTHTLHESATTYSPDDTGLKNTLSVNQDGDRYYFDRVLSNSPWSRDHRRDIPLFELPRQPLVSIGQLQHLYIHGMPPYSVGNPWGGSTWNRLFDEYFLSGVQTGISEPDFSGPATTSIPHPRLMPANPLDLNIASFDNSTLTSLAEDSAVAFQIKGQFNLNSTSQDAWKAVFAGARLAGLNYVVRDSNLHDALQTYSEVDNDVNFPPGFTRFPQSIQELLDVDLTDFNPSYDPGVIHMKPGVTFLKPRETVSAEPVETDYGNNDSMIEAMAIAITSAIQTRTQTVGRPFFSLNEFLTEPFQSHDSILEYVIDTSGLRRVVTPSSTFTPEDRTPSWLSQADVISALAPFLSTRSDTFIIRTYGSVSDTSGSDLSRAWCEVVVQRVITPVDNDGLTAQQMAAEPLSPYGRRFKIISFKWLTESEI